MRFTPEIEKEIAPFQVEGVEFLSSRRYALLGDEMGLGKTMQTLCALYQTPKVRALVLCPATVKIGWQRSIARWGLPFTSQVIQSSKDKIQDVEIIIINYEQTIKKTRREQLMNQKFTHIICDESHYLKDFESQRTETVLGVCGLRQRAENIWCLSGTPVLNRPVELYPVLKSLCPERLGKYRNWMRYTQRFCQGHYDNWGYNAAGKSNLDHLAKILDGFMLRRLANQVDFGMTEKEYTKVIIPVTTRIRKIDQEGRKQATTLNELGGEVSSARMEIGLRKVDHAVRHIDYLLTTKDKIVVYGYHRDVMRELNKRLKKHNPVLVYGGINNEKKQHLIDHFINTPSCKIFLANILSVGIGVDGLQQAADTALFVELVSTPGRIHQAADRLRRKGQRNNVLIQALVYEDSYDEEILESFTVKEKTIDIITRDKKGVTRLSERRITTFKRRRKMSQQIMDKIDELIDAFADQIIERVKSRLETQQPEQPVKESQKTEPKKAEAAQPQKKAAPKTITKKNDVTTVSQVQAVRGALSSYLATLGSDEDTGRKKAMNQIIARRLKEEVGVLVIEQCDAQQLAKYQDVLIEEFKKEFGEDVWQSIAL